jgi:hypothetical protein
MFVDISIQGYSSMIDQISFPADNCDGRTSDNNMPPFGEYIVSIVGHFYEKFNLPNLYALRYVHHPIKMLYPYDSSWGSGTQMVADIWLITYCANQPPRPIS